jgi:hypothetical protein
LSLFIVYMFRLTKVAIIRPNVLIDNVLYKITSVVQTFLAYGISLRHKLYIKTMCIYILLQNYVFAQQWDHISEKSLHNTCNFIQNIVYQYNRPDYGYFG